MKQVSLNAHDFRYNDMIRHATIINAFFLKNTNKSYLSHCMLLPTYFFQPPHWNWSWFLIVHHIRKAPASGVRAMNVPVTNHLSLFHTLILGFEYRDLICQDIGISCFSLKDQLVSSMPNFETWNIAAHLVNPHFMFPHQYQSSLTRKHSQP